ncbi:MAG: hypothetical protein J5965_15125 [Aeriscardovia sp.]|nr:hypothetical protein [Aeriscardovia sp.]
MAREILEGDPLRILKPYLGHWDVPDDGDLVLTIDKIYKDDVKNQHGTETKPIIYFIEPDAKPMILNKTNRDSITKLHGRRTKTNDWHGCKVALYAGIEPKSADGYALRVRDYIPKETTAICEDCGRTIVAHGDYSVNKIVAMSKAKYGASLCWDCSVKRKEAE